MLDKNYKNINKQLIKVFSIEFLGFKIQYDEKQVGRLWISKNEDIKYLTRDQVNNLEGVIKNWFDSIE